MPDASPQKAAPPKEPVETPDLRGVGNNRLIDIYQLFLVLLIVGYFLALITAAVQLTRFAIQLALITLQPTNLAFLSALGCVAVLVFVVQLLWRLRRDLPGLVTTVYDPLAEAWQEGIVLDRDEYPGLYELIGEVGRRLEAPMPDEVRLSHNHECYVAEARRFALRTKRRLIMVLGMPQMTVLNVNELKVILAHEMAHFRRGDTTVDVFIFRFLESFRRAQEELDAWPANWASPVYWFVMLYRRIFLWLAAPIQRYHELQADAVSAAAYGGELSTDTLIKDWLLGYQFHMAVAACTAATTGNVPQNIYEFFRQQWFDFSDAGKDYLRKRLAQEERSSFLDADPTIQERIDVMRRFPDVKLPPPIDARLLLHNLAKLQDDLQEQLIAENQHAPKSAAAGTPAGTAASKATTTSGANAEDQKESGTGNNSHATSESADSQPQTNGTAQ